MIIKGYPTAEGYMGLCEDGKYRLFATEDEYVESLKESEVRNETD